MDEEEIIYRIPFDTFAKRFNYEEYQFPMELVNNQVQQESFYQTIDSCTSLLNQYEATTIQSRRKSQLVMSLILLLFIGVPIVLPILSRVLLRSYWFQSYYMYYIPCCCLMIAIGIVLFVYLSKRYYQSQKNLIETMYHQIETLLEHENEDYYHERHVSLLLNKSGTLSIDVIHYQVVQLEDHDAITVIDV
jgi:hypothetical protein